MTVRVGETATPPPDLLPVQRKATLAYRLARFILLPIFHAVFVFQVRGHDTRSWRTTAAAQLVDPPALTTGVGLLRLLCHR
jgi:hypothetical protein